MILDREMLENRFQATNVFVLDTLLFDVRAVAATTVGTSKWGGGRVASKFGTKQVCSRCSTNIMSAKYILHKGNLIQPSRRNPA